MKTTEKTLLRPPGKTEDKEEAKEFPAELDPELPNFQAEWPGALPRTALELRNPIVLRRFAPEVILPFLERMRIEFKRHSHLLYEEKELTEA